MAVAGNIVMLCAAAGIVWLAMQWMAARAGATVGDRSARRDLAMYTPPQQLPCGECDGVGGTSDPAGVQLCAHCEGTGIAVLS